MNFVLFRSFLSSDGRQLRLKVREVLNLFIKDLRRMVSTVNDADRIPTDLWGLTDSKLLIIT